MPTQQIKIIDNGIVVSRPNQMYGWPGLTIAKNGDVIAAASERKKHVDPFGRVVIMRSKDCGYTWELPEEIYNSELDDRDSTIQTLEDGTLVLSWFTSLAFAENYPQRAARVSAESKNDLLGTKMLLSFDNGNTWETEPKNIPVGIHISPISLSDGSLISIEAERSFQKTGEHKKDAPMHVYKSWDRGENWEKVSEIYCVDRDSEGNPMIGLGESHVLEVSPGKLTIMFRSYPHRKFYLYQAFSEDFGKTWTEPQNTGIWGYPPHMLKLSDGKILLTYSHRKDPYSIKGVVSYDNAVTWDTKNTFTIYQWDDEPDMGYPTTVELENKELLTVFYCHRDKTWQHLKQVPDSSPQGLLFVRYKLSF